MRDDQFPISKGIPYPRSGQIVGYAADFLRLKGYLRDDWAASYKTAQRYFSGEPIQEAKELLRTLVDALIPKGVSLPSAISETPADVQEWTCDAADELLRQWDQFAGGMNGISFPLIDRALAPVPILRLLMLDTGIRWAAYHAISGSEPSAESAWLMPDCLGRIIDELRGKDRSLAALAESAEVSLNTLNAWRTGSSIPTDANIKAMVAVLGDDPGNAFRLRLATAITACRSYLSRLCGKARIDDLVSALGTTIRLAHRALKFAPIPQDARAEALRDLVRCGGRARAGARLSTLLAESSPLNQEVQADFLALPQEWHPRLTYWAKTFAALKQAPSVLPKHMNISTKKAKRLAPLIEAMTLKMSGFDRLPAGMPTLVVKGDPFTSAMNRVIQSDRASSVGDLVGAVAHARRAVHLQPQNAELHFSLGARLGQLMANGDRSRLEEALQECRIAVQLAPEWDKPRTELGVILSNAGLLEEAEVAFAAAEPYARDVAHFHFARGNNFIWLGRLERAAESFTLALDLAKGFLELRLHLAAVLAHLGREDDLKRVAAEIKRLGGPAVTTAAEWKQFLPGQCWERAAPE